MAAAAKVIEVLGVPFFRKFVQSFNSIVLKQYQ